ncbi:uncharacterized protein N7518_000136 [Penicillium psychrosexuale]|uniref:uncharacterized protein n=1 Tax=Penicillium psychrosexuale TaxID=1002107 RepID=UPI002545AEAC|nr:uncharacterized protein N7518_000136 [Penicillium psychrosexuale]KAJ5803833.1 hypothetical protein N7518_000136 [Penicillium psychrosexuale]
MYSESAYDLSNDKMIILMTILITKYHFLDVANNLVISKRLSQFLSPYELCHDPRLWQILRILLHKLSISLSVVTAIAPESIRSDRLFLPTIGLLLALQWSGTEYSWNNPWIIVLFVLIGVLLRTFVAVQICQNEKATPPPRIVRNRHILS